MLPIRTGRSAFCLLPGMLGFALAVCASTDTAIAQQGNAFLAPGAPLLDGLPPEVATHAQLQRGQELFMREWKAGDSATPTGDGLGPVFNAKSCADCHNMGSVGGAGTKESDVDLLSLILPSHMDHTNRLTFRERMILFDPSFAVGTNSIRPSITLHKSSTNPAYSEWRRKLLVRVAPEPSDLKGLLVKRTPAKSDSSPIPASSAASMPKVTLPSRGAEKAAPVQFQLTHRNTPALFGAGLIDSIPDAVIQLAAKHQAESYIGIRGKVALAGSGGVGKFGWRGQIGSLKEFVMGACSNELGLQVPGEEQPIDPLDPAHKSPGLDLTQEQCDDLTAFVANLPAPTRRQPANAKDSEQMAAGEHLFSTTGCAVCHMERLGNVTGIYSDLLLHDMGSTLADPVAANSKLPSSEHAAFESRSFSGGYNGGGGGGGPNGPDVFVAVPPATLREWRTPPLWGVANSAPYLHDGRAATLADAILAHEGEANFSRKNYAALSSRDRAKLLAFLNSLTVAQ